MDNTVIGLDIGTTKVCTVIGEYNEKDELEIIGIGTSPSKGIRRGVVVNIEATLHSVVEAIEAAELMSGREANGVYTGIAGAHIDGINSKGVVAVTGKNREITREDVERVIDAAKAIVIPMDREVFHVIPQEYIVDDQGGVKNPLDMIGIRLEAEVHIITGSVTSAQNLLKCVNRAGFKVNDIILGSLASSAAILSEDEKELALSYENPARFDHLKMLRNSNWEFGKWDKLDMIGFLISCSTVVAIVGLLFVMVSIGG